MDASDRIKFEPVIAAGQHVHCYLDDYYVARISVHADHCGVDGPGGAVSGAERGGGAGSD